MNASEASDVKADVQLRMRLQREIARASDGYYQAAVSLAERMQGALTLTQVRSLENVAYTTVKVSDIFDLVKTQIGRDKWPLALGQAVLDALNECQTEAGSIARDLDTKDVDLPRRTHLLLCREYVKHLAAHFIYLTALSKRREVNHG